MLQFDDLFCFILEWFKSMFQDIKCVTCIWSAFTHYMTWRCTSFWRDRWSCSCVHRQWMSGKEKGKLWKDGQKAATKLKIDAIGVQWMKHSMHCEDEWIGAKRTALCDASSLSSPVACVVRLKDLERFGFGNHILSYHIPTWISYSWWIYYKYLHVSLNEFKMHFYTVAYFWPYQHITKRLFHTSIATAV